jgi:Transmembrane secretion effector
VTPSSTLEPLRLPAFRRLGGAYFANEVGNWLGDVALALLVFHATGSTLATAVLLLATQGLPAVAAPLLTARLSTSPLRRTLPALYVAEAVVFGVIALGLPEFAWGVVVALAAVDGALAVGARALSRAAIANTLTPAGLLREGNALVNVAFTTAAALGPPAAGVLVATLGGRATLALDAASFVVAAALLVGLDDRLAAPDDAGLSWSARLRDGLGYAIRTPLVRFLLVAQGASLVFFSAVLPVEVALATSTLHAGETGYGALLASWGVAMPVGALLFARRGSTQLGVLAVVASFAVGVSYLVTGLAPTLLVACAGAALGGAGNAVQWVSFVTLLQAATAERRQAAVAGALEALSSAMPAVGFALGGIVAAVAGARAGYLVAAGGVFAVLGLALALRPRSLGVGAQTPRGPDASVVADLPGQPVPEPTGPMAS